MESPKENTASSGQRPRPTVSLSEKDVIPEVPHEPVAVSEQPAQVPEEKSPAPKEAAADLSKKEPSAHDSGSAWKKMPEVKTAKLNKRSPMLPPPKAQSGKSVAAKPKILRPAGAAPTQSAAISEEKTPTPSPGPVAKPPPPKKKIPVSFITSGILVVAIIGFLIAGQFSKKKKSVAATQAQAAAAVVQSAAPQVQPAAPTQPAAAVQAQLAEGQPWQIPGLGITMKWIPPGKALLGSSADERSAMQAKLPASEAHIFKYEPESEQPIASGFWLGQTEVTIGQWKQFIAAHPDHQTAAEKKGSATSISADGSLAAITGASWRDPVPGMTAGDDLPVTCIVPADAEAFCAWLTAREREAGRLPANYAFRLPAEAEWDYACRGGAPSRTAYWWGSDPDSGAGRCNAAGAEFTKKYSASKVSEFSWSDPFTLAAPVDSFGEKGRNGYGLADMLGNVWECVAKPLMPKYTHAWRGGSFADGQAIVRCASTRHRYTTGPSCNAGFRLCLSKTD